MTLMPTMTEEAEVDQAMESADTTAVQAIMPPDSDAARVAVSRRLRPLVVASGLNGILLWIPTEKLFMNQIGFDAASMGVVAATYAIATQLLEIPSGILADRWSRRGVLILANAALALASLVGAMSHSVTTYLVAAMFLGVFFALHSGTVESIVYDTIVEQTGSSDTFERTLGRINMISSAALVASALAGAALAAVTSPRLTFIVTVPFVLASIPVLLRFREPCLHRGDNTDLTIRQQVALTYRTLLRQRTLRPIIGAMVTGGVLMQSVYEFGPLWLVAFAAPTILYGPHWASLMGASGIGAAIAGRLDFTRPATGRIAVVVMLACSTTLVTVNHVGIVIAAQICLVLILVIVGIHLNRLLHDAIPSHLRAGIASGVGTLTSATFLPFALTFGYFTKHAGIHTGGMVITAAALATAAALTRLATTPRAATVAVSSP